MTTAVPAPDLAARTLQLVDVPSESRSEAAPVELVRAVMPGEPRFDDGEVLLYGDGPSSSPGISTRSRRRRTSRAGSRTARCTGSARAT